MDQFFFNSLSEAQDAAQMLADSRKCIVVISREVSKQSCSPIAFVVRTDKSELDSMGEIVAIFEPSDCRLFKH